MMRNTLIAVIMLFISNFAYAEQGDFFYNEDGSIYYLDLVPNKAFVIPKVMDKAIINPSALKLTPDVKILNLERVDSIERGYMADLSRPLLVSEIQGVVQKSNSQMRVLPVFTAFGKNYFVPIRHIIVRLTSKEQEAAFTKVAQKQGLKIVGKIENKRSIYLRLKIENNNLDEFAVSRSLFEQKVVSFAQPDFMRRVVLHYSPNDYYYAKQWYLNNTGQDGAQSGNDINVELAWDISRGNISSLIGVIDDGVEWDHEDISGRVKYQYDFLDNDTDATPVAGTSPVQGDPVGHGTSVAGVAAAIGNNSIGISGVCPECGLIGVRLIGNGYITDYTIAQAFDYAVGRGAGVINNSWGADLGDPLQSGDEPSRPIAATPATKSAIKDAVNDGRNGLGTVVIFAAGNSNCDVSLDGTTALPDVIAVSASTDHGDRAYYSNYGDEIWVNAPSNGFGRPYDNAATAMWSVDVMGSGGYNTGSSWSGDSKGNYTNQFGGTSGAAPVVTGLVGLMIAANPNITAQQIKEILQDTSDKIDTANGKYDNGGHSIYYGYGRINAEEALMAAIGAQCYPREEVCDKRDNDCDNQIDEDNVCVGYAQFCETCESDINCADDGAICRSGQEGKYCTRPCNPSFDNCPPGSSCEVIEGTSETQCRPKYDRCSSLITGADLICYTCTGYSPSECGPGGVCLVDSNGKPGCAIPCESGGTCPGSGNSCFDLQDADGKSYGYFCFPSTQRCAGDMQEQGKEVCERCISPKECGGAKDRCINYSTNPMVPDGYCGSDCSSASCPKGFTCQMFESGSTVQEQCVPASGSCLPAAGAAKLGCGSDAICSFIDKTTGWVCVPKNYSGSPSGQLGQLYGKCNADLTCATGACVTASSLGTQPICLMTNCLPEIQKVDSKDPEDVPLALCMTDEECTEIPLGDSTSTWVCLPKYADTMKAPWGTMGESGGFCDSGNSCTGSLCMTIWATPEYTVCLNKCDPGGKLPSKEEDKCKNGCSGGFSCQSTPDGKECVTSCDPAKILCSDGRACNDSGNGQGYCWNEPVEPSKDGGSSDSGGDDASVKDSGPEDIGSEDTGGSSTTDASDFDFGIPFPDIGKPDTSTLEGDDDSDNSGDDDSQGDDDDTEPGVKDESGCSCRVR